MRFTIQSIRKKREIFPVTFKRALFYRKKHWNLNIDKVEETVKKGEIITKPKRVYFRKYFAKSKEQYIVSTVFRKNYIEVVSAWQMRKS
ncbi:hypothetical protein KY339_03420 [Candidatus Woesearchaeota archaeon]|nr:hypothetical protein [Candidatus Woesearchaeota archaeon]